jgi:CheY-like chemotaxis protein
MAKILIVDDEPDLIFLSKKMLEIEGHAVTGAKNSEEGFRKIRKERPDIILMDVMMPDDDGWEACKKIKESDETSDIPVVMFTVRSSEDSVERSLKYANADAQINKPFDKKDLLNTIENLLKKKAA